VDKEKGEANQGGDLVNQVTAPPESLELLFRYLSIAARHQRQSHSKNTGYHRKLRNDYYLYASVFLEECFAFGGNWPEYDHALPPTEWTALLIAVMRRVTITTFTTWFSPTRQTHKKGNTLFVSVPAPTFVAVLTRTYADMIKSVQQELGTDYMIRYIMRKMKK
jgi:hypothetical protein